MLRLILNSVDYDLFIRVFNVLKNSVTEKLEACVEAGVQVFIVSGGPGTIENA